MNVRGALLPRQADKVSGLLAKPDIALAMPKSGVSYITRMRTITGMWVSRLFMQFRWLHPSRLKLWNYIVDG